MKYNCLVWTLLIGVVSGFPFQIKNVENAGFVSEQIGKVHLYNEVWKIVAFTNITNYVMELNRIIEYEVQIESLCEVIKNHSTRSCALVPEQLKLIIADIRSMEQLLPNAIKGKRQKRGLFNFVGEINSFLFGTLARSDGLYFNEQIDRLSKNQIQQHDLIKKQTSIIKSSIEVQKEMVKNQESQAILVQEKFNKLSSSLKIMLTRINEEFIVIQQTQALDELMTYVILLATRCKDRFQLLSQSLIAKHEEPNFAAFLQPKMLYRELQNINNLKNAETSLPIELDMNSIIQYYKMGSPKIGVVDGMLLLKLEIPLIERNSFDVIKITPVPVKIENDLFSILVPNHEMVALSEDKKKYAIISEGELDHCEVIPSKGYACPNLPVFNSELNPICEVAIVKRDIQGIDKCDLKVLRIKTEFWMSLHSKFSWVFAVNKKTNAFITDRSGKRFQIDITNSGMVILEAGAKLESDAVSVKAPTYERIELELEYVSGNNTPDFSLYNMDAIKVDFPSAPFLIKSTALDKLEKITRDIKDLERQEQIPLLEMLKRNEYGSQYWSSIGTLIIVLIVLFIIWRLGCCPGWKCLCNLCRKPKRRHGRTRSLSGRRVDIEEDDKGEDVSLKEFSLKPSLARQKSVKIKKVLETPKRIQGVGQDNCQGGLIF